MYKVLFASLIIALLAGCEPHKPAIDPVTRGSVFVVCEGSLGNGNSALTKYDPDSDAVVAIDAYNAATGKHLGDIFQSMNAANGAYYLCINNSDKIIILNPSGLAEEGILSVPKPRYLLPVGSGKAYVSTLFSNKVYTISTTSEAVTGSFALPHNNAEGMALVGGTVYICTWDTAASVIYKADITKDIVTDSIAIPGRSPQEIVQDADGMLWVLSGNKAEGAGAMLTRLNPATGAVLQHFSFGNADPLRLVANPAKDTLYFLEISYNGGSASNGVYRMGIHDAALPSTAFIAAQGQQYFWGVDIHPRSGYIYVADPKGFTQNGHVTIYRQDGTRVTSFVTGVGPGHFYFE